MLNNTNYIMRYVLTSKNYITSLNVILISFLPIGLLIGSLISNLVIFLINVLFIADIHKKKDWNYFNETNFYFLLVIYLYLIFNSFFISENDESITKSIGFIRYILLTYAISYYFKTFHNQIIKIWFLFFLIVSGDLIFEFIFGKNIFGFESFYPGRLTGFTGDEHKIGGFYFGFVFLALSFLFNKKIFLFYFFSLCFFIIAVVIGERSNFIKILIMYLFFFLFFINISYFKKIFVIFIMFIFSFFIILQMPGLKSKYINHIYNDELKLFLNSDQEVEFLDVISSNQHFSHYYVALKIFEENKIFGSGFKSFRLESYKEKYKKEIYGSSNHPHQFHFEILSELGLVGYFLIISNLFFVLYRKIKDKKKNVFSNSALIFIIVSMIPILPTGSFFTSYGATIFFINYSFLIRSKSLHDTSFKRLTKIQNSIIKKKI